MKKGVEIEIPNLHDKIKINKTTQYLLPCLELKDSRLNYKYLKEQGFLAAYLGYDSDYMDFRDSLFLLFNPSLDRLSQWYDFYELYSKEKRFNFEYDLGVNIVLLIFKLPDKYKFYPQFLLQGKYSKFSAEYAKKFLISDGVGKIEKLQQYLIIMKDKEFRSQLQEKLGYILDDKAELEEIPDRNKEILFLKDLN